MKYLYVNGCSFTKHRPLAESDLWPTMLADCLGIPEVINHAQGAGGNDRIFKSVSKFLLDADIPLCDILAVIQITFPFRFELPLCTEHSGWMSYLPNYNFQNTGNLEDDINYEYYLSKMKIYAQHDCQEVWDFYQQTSAISNLLKSSGLKHYFICNNNPPQWPNATESTGGNSVGNPTTTIEFNHSDINWLYDDPWQSNMYHHVKNLLGLKVSEYTISDQDIHFNKQTHQKLCELWAEQINLKEQS
jgi:hypothetical protein